MPDATSSAPLVTTIRERCRACYTCVRECPAKAIQILDGQASVIQARCIGCGNCVTVCSQQAKLVASGVEATEILLSGSAPVAAIVAPSYPAEFTECATSGLVAALRALGFTYVHEVGFGADLVAARYARLLDEQDTGRFIATTCPAVVNYVRKYHPDLLDHPGAHRLADARHGAGTAAQVWAGHQGGLRRTLHRQEGRGRRRAPPVRGRRRPHLRGTARHAGAARHRARRVTRRRFRRAAQRPRGALPHHARHAPGGGSRPRIFSAATSSVPTGAPIWSTPSWNSNTARPRRDCSTSSAARAASWARASAVMSPLFKRRSDVSRETRARHKARDEAALARRDGAVCIARPLALFAPSTSALTICRHRRRSSRSWRA